MPYYYSDPKRENKPHARPDVEVFEDTRAAQCRCCGVVEFDSREPAYLEHVACENPRSEYIPGWFYAFGLPGCLWDSEPVGPFATEAEALAAAREGVES
jgi:hypothetical protein